MEEPPGGHNVVATVIHEGPARTTRAPWTWSYNTAGGQVPTVMYGVPSDEVYGPPSHRLLNIKYDSEDEANPTTNDMPDAIWIGFGGSVGSDDSSVMTASSPGPASTATLSATTIPATVLWYKSIQKAPECGATGLLVVAT